MKYVLMCLRCVLAAVLLLPVLGLSYCCGYQHTKLLEEIYKEPYLCISPDAVNPANEGRKVQLAAPAFTDEWLELRDIGVRCQALRLTMDTGGGRHAENQYRGRPLRSWNKHARHIRMGAFSLKLRENDTKHLGNQKLPMELVHLPEEWKPYCREVQGEQYNLNLVLEDNPPRKLRCSMVVNGTPAWVRGIQRGNEISPVHCVVDNEKYLKSHDSWMLERAHWDAWVAQGAILMVPALLLGAFRLLRCRRAGNSAPLAIFIMLVLEAAAFICCGGWRHVAWACVAAGVLLVCLWQIRRITSGFRVDSAAQ